MKTRSFDLDNPELDNIDSDPNQDSRTAAQKMAKLLGTSRDELLKDLSEGPIMVTADDTPMFKVEIIDGKFAVTRIETAAGNA